MQSRAADVHWQYFSFMFKLSLVIIHESASAVQIRSIFAGDNIMQSIVIHWAVTQVLVTPVYIIETSQVSNHGWQAMLTWHRYPARWLYLHLKIIKSSESKLKFLQWRQCLHWWSLLSRMRLQYCLWLLRIINVGPPHYKCESCAL